MSDEMIPMLDVDEAAQRMADVYERVTTHHTRVELIRAGSRESCVLISKVELENLERALEILGDTDGVRSLREAVGGLLAGKP